MNINNSPLVTIATPMYNVEKYLVRYLDSVLTQTYPNIEIVLIDDGSTDKSGKIGDEYARKDKRIKIIHQSNKGFSGARNAALDNATGDFITFIDADDYVLPDYVEYLLKLILKSNADIAISKNCFTTLNMTQIKKETFEIYSPQKAVEEFFYPRIQLGAWNKIYRMSFLKKNHLKFISELKTGEGLQFITLAASLANKIAVGNKKVYVYRINNPKSATTKVNVIKQGLGALETMQYIKRTLPMHDDKIKRAYIVHLWNTYKYCLRQIIESSTQKEYYHLYKHCRKYLKRNSLSIIFTRINIKFKIEALITSISPDLLAKLAVLKKRHRLSIKQLDL